MALEKFYIVYGVAKDGVKDWRGNNRTFTKSDVEWFGVDEKMALQRFKSGHHVPYPPRKYLPV